MHALFWFTKLHPCRVYEAIKGLSIYATSGYVQSSTFGSTKTELKIINKNTSIFYGISVLELLHWGKQQTCIQTPKKLLGKNIRTKGHCCGELNPSHIVCVFMWKRWRKEIIQLLTNPSGKTDTF